VRDAGEEHIGATEGRGVVGVRAAADGRKGRRLGAVVVEEEAKERRWVECAEAAAEGRGGSDGVQEGVAGDGGADEARKGGETEEDLAEEVIAEGAYSGSRGWCFGFAGGDGGGGLRWEAMPCGATAAWFATGLYSSPDDCGPGRFLWPSPALFPFRPP
jgi:hypothetical protein